MLCWVAFNIFGLISPPANYWPVYNSTAELEITMVGGFVGGGGVIDIQLLKKEINNYLLQNSAYCLEAYRPLLCR